jgi:zinc ribbon protein
MPECKNCGADVPEESRFCLQCGRPLGEPEPAPKRRLGLPIALPTLSPVTVAAIALALGAVILLAGGVWAWGVVALLGAAVLVLLPGRIERRQVNDLRLRAEAMRESLAVRGRGQVEVFRARRELAELEADRGRLYWELGRAVYEKDKAGTNAARRALDAVSGRIQAKEAEIETLIRETEERVRRVQTPVQPTAVLDDEAPPEPPRVPEPWPPPDEGDIPEPPQPEPGGPTPGPDEPAPPARPPAPGGSRKRR